MLDLLAGEAGQAQTTAALDGAAGGVAGAAAVVT